MAQLPFFNWEWTIGLSSWKYVFDRLISVWLIFFFSSRGLIAAFDMVAHDQGCYTIKLQASSVVNDIKILFCSRRSTDD